MKVPLIWDTHLPTDTRCAREAQSQLINDCLAKKAQDKKEAKDRHHQAKIQKELVADSSVCGDVAALHLLTPTLVNSNRNHRVFIACSHIDLTSHYQLFEVNQVTNSFS